ncbi:unnamed protein product [Brassica oleracea var. botrytis]
MFPENVIFSSLEANVLISPNSFQSCKMTQNYAKNALRQFSEVIPKVLTT